MKRSPLSALFAAALLILLLFSPSAGRADELSEEADPSDAVYAVQRRRLLTRHEFNISFGVLPLDALHVGLTPGVGYTYHFNSLIGWQIGHFRYNVNIDTSTIAELSRLYMAQPATVRAPVQMLVDSNVLFKILSGKAVLGGGVLAGGEVAIVAGPAISILTTQQVQFGANLGLSMRALLNRWFSANLDVRFYETLGFRPAFTTTEVLDVSIGASLNLR